MSDVLNPQTSDFYPAYWDLQNKTGGNMGVAQQSQEMVENQ